MARRIAVFALVIALLLAATSHAFYVPRIKVSPPHLAGFLEQRVCVCGTRCICAVVNKKFL